MGDTTDVFLGKVGAGFSLLPINGLSSGIG